MLKNCILISRSNWKARDFKNLKRFAMQDCALNFCALIYKPFHEKFLEEYTILDMELRFNSKYDPLDWIGRSPMRKRFVNCRFIRVRGQIQTASVIEMLRSIYGNFFPRLELLYAETLVPPTKFVIKEVEDLTNSKECKKVFSWSSRKIKRRE